LVRWERLFAREYARRMLDIPDEEPPESPCIGKRYGQPQRSAATQDEKHHTRATGTCAGPKHFLARRASGALCFQMRPDIVVLKPDTPPIIVDTKWKRLKQNGTKEAISTADLYQMFAYSQSYNAKSVILLYPHNQELGDWKACLNRYYFENNSGGQGQVLHIATVQLNDLKLAQTQLQSIFLRTLSSS
jgi:hypothetical protein